LPNKTIKPNEKHNKSSSGSWSNLVSAVADLQVDLDKELDKPSGYLASGTEMLDGQSIAYDLFLDGNHRGHLIFHWPKGPELVPFDVKAFSDRMVYSFVFRGKPTSLTTFFNRALQGN
jgi:hypothetical protein